MELNYQIRTIFDRRKKATATIKGSVKTMSRQRFIDIDALKSDKVALTAKVSSRNSIEWLHERIMKRPVAESTCRQHLVMLEDLKKLGRIVNFSDLTNLNEFVGNG